MWQPQIIPRSPKDVFNNPPPPPFFFWFLSKNIIPENLADTARKRNISQHFSGGKTYPENTFPSQMANFALLCMWCLLWIAWLSKIILDHLKKLWHPFSQPSVQMNGHLPSTEAKNRVRKYFSMPQLGTQKGIILKSHLRHQGLWEINNVQSQHAQLVPTAAKLKGWKRNKKTLVQKKKLASIYGFKDS